MGFLRVKKSTRKKKWGGFWGRREGFFKLPGFCWALYSEDDRIRFFLARFFSIFLAIAFFEQAFEVPELQSAEQRRSVRVEPPLQSQGFSLEERSSGCSCVPPTCSACLWNADLAGPCLEIREFSLFSEDLGSYDRIPRNQ